ncbi:class I SAM-dependent methyltransferase [Pedobacter alpinus]|uniref:Class I SAM-dependent methyltransferase n=1 Tax=Pedobacter alpinus TaxID=1590643 RepID=A0ABW5TNC2_9SPHI
MKNEFKIKSIWKERGFSFLIKTIYYRVFRKQIKNINYLTNLFSSKSGLEVGGPSRTFQDKRFIPIYGFLENLDGCNFSNKTIWEGEIKNGMQYNYYRNKTGFQYISEATDLSLVESSKYDFIISCNCLEHVANPFKALEEWLRVVKSGGLILILLPNKKHCFDHKRPVTEFAHLMEDFKNNTTEDDLTHLDEILELHDLEMDKPAGNLEQFKKRSMSNFENRALHHHVFSINLLKEIFSYFKIDVLLTDEEQDLVILGRKF